jgi:hypothetical protein
VHGSDAAILIAGRHFAVLTDAGGTADDWQGDVILAGLPWRNAAQRERRPASLVRAFDAMRSPCCGRACDVVARPIGVIGVSTLGSMAGCCADSRAGSLPPHLFSAASAVNPQYTDENFFNSGARFSSIFSRCTIRSDRGISPLTWINAAAVGGGH